MSAAHRRSPLPNEVPLQRAKTSLYMDFYHLTQLGSTNPPLPVVQPDGLDDGTDGPQGFLCYSKDPNVLPSMDEYIEPPDTTRSSGPYRVVGEANSRRSSLTLIKSPSKEDELKKKRAREFRQSDKKDSPSIERKDPPLSLGQVRQKKDSKVFNILATSGSFSCFSCKEKSKEEE